MAVPLGRDPAPPARPAPTARRVAVLDCSGEVARVLERYLDLHEVRRVRTPNQAWRAIAEDGARALIVTSAEVAAEWEEFRHGHHGPADALASTPTVLCPLRTRGAIARSLGLADYLVKPVTREQLGQALRRLDRRPDRIVVVEDDAEMGALVGRLVRSFLPRCQVHHGRDGEAGLELIRDHHPDVVLLDLLMPNVDGFAVLEALRADASLRAIPVIVISARGIEEEVLVSKLEVSRGGGLSVGEAVSCLKACLDALLPTAAETAQAPPLASLA